MLMVARTGNSTPTASTNPTPSVNNYMSPAVKMTLPQNLLHPIESWTKHDVQKWIEYCIDEYSLGDVHLNDFEMNGKALLLLTEDSFKQRSPRAGDILHKALQQHKTTLKSFHCQTFPYQLWNNFAFPPSSSARRFNIPPPPPLPMSSFHSANTAGALPHAVAASCMHPAFNYVFNHSEAMAKSSLLTHRANYPNSSQQQPMQNQDTKGSTKSTHARDTKSVKASQKSHVLLPVLESGIIKREVISPGPPTSSRQPTPNSSPVTTNTISPPIKQECTDMDDEDVDIEQHDTAPTPPITSSSPSTSPQSSSSVLSKLSPYTHEAIPFKIRSQLLSRIKQQPNDVTNTSENNQHPDGDGLVNDQTRQIRYYHDRIDFRGDILLKPPGAKNCRILWEFLYILLEDSQYESIIHWEDRDKMIFRIIQADKLAALWGLQKNRLSMTYEKLSRGMRYYYSNNIISKEQSKRLLYRFMRSPDEIRKSMKRNGGSTNMMYSTMNKKSSASSPFPLKTQSHEQQTNDLDNEDSSLSSSSPFPIQPTSQIHHQLLQLFSAYPSSTAATMVSNLNSANALFLAAHQATNPASSSFSTGDTKPAALLPTLSKNDRSNSSTPESFDSSRDRTSDSEKQHCSPSQSLSSSSASSHSTSTKRKQAVPISLTARLSSQHHHVDQPLNLAVHKDEEILADCKKAKVLSPPSTA